MRSIIKRIVAIAAVVTRVHVHSLNTEKIPPADVNPAKIILTQSKILYLLW